MRFLLTGGSGFVGQTLAAVLNSKGHTVRALVRKSSVLRALESAGAEIVVGDICSGDGVEAALKGVDVVMHLAGATKGRTEDDYFRVNAEATRVLAEKMSQMKKPPRLVLCSSIAAGGPARLGAPLRETDTPSPLSVYGRSKLAGEKAARQYADKVPTVIVRPPTVYGPADKEFLGSFLTMGKLGLFVKPGFGPKEYSLIHVNDLCEALVAAAEKGKTISAERPDDGVYYVSDGREYRWEEFCAAFSRALGRRDDGRIIPVPGSLAYLVGLGAEVGGRILGTVPIMNRDKAREIVHEAWTCSSERARNELEFVPAYTLQSGLAHSVDWFRKEGWL